LFKFAIPKGTNFFYTQNFNHSVLISKENILASAKKLFYRKAESIAKLTDFLDENFIEATQNIYNSKGRLIRNRKSAIIAQKMVATFNSTGTPSLFLHASEAIHGI
jgi:arabinose-5-phosphate isomerase